MPLTLEMVGSASLLNPLSPPQSTPILFSPEGPCCICVSSPISGGSICLEGGCLHCRRVRSWQQKLCSVLVVFVLFSLFACEESKLTHTQKEFIKHFLIFSWRNLMWNLSSKYLPQYENNEGQQQQTPDDATNQNPERDGNSSALQHLQHSLKGTKERWRARWEKINFMHVLLLRILLGSYLPPDCSCAQSNEASLLSREAIHTYYPHWLIFGLQKETHIYD